MLDLNLGASPKPGSSAFIKITDEMKFEQDVLVASMKVPVIVDFWAAWCGPCKQMAPVLEKVINEAGGAVLMVKVDIDRNPDLAQALRVQSVPTLYAFYLGKPVDGLAGARPESELRAFVQKLKALAGIHATPEDTAAATADQVKKLMTAGDQFFQQGKLHEAMEQYSTALEVNPESMDALGGIGWSLLTQGDAESVRGMLEQLTPEQLKAPRLQGLKFILSMAERTEGLADIPTLEKKPKDLQAQYDLALQYLAAGQLEKGIDTLIALIRANRDWQEQKARKLVLEIFDALGNVHPLTSPGRRKLSAVLFS